MQPVVIGIAGGSGSGKTTLAHAVASSAPVPSARLAFDSYYRDQRDRTIEERTRVNYDHPNSLDVERFVADLATLRAGRQLAAPVYDFTVHTRSSAVDVIEPRPMVIVDGILLFVFPEVCELLDLRVFVDVSDVLRTERRLERDIAERGRTREQALEQIERTVRPMYGEFVQPSIDQADVVVDGTVPPTQSAGRVLAALPAGVLVG
ncbi:MAG: uridine kinase [Actinomycetota bacterium]